jgi:hypothetical protein
MLTKDCWLIDQSSRHRGRAMTTTPQWSDLVLQGAGRHDELSVAVADTWVEITALLHDLSVESRLFKAMWCSAVRAWKAFLWWIHFNRTLNLGSYPPRKQCASPLPRMGTEWNVTDCYAGKLSCHGRMEGSESVTAVIKQYADSTCWTYRILPNSGSAWRQLLRHVMWGWAGAYVSSHSASTKMSLLCWKAKFCLVITRHLR